MGREKYDPRYRYWLYTGILTDYLDMYLDRSYCTYEITNEYNEYYITYNIQYNYDIQLQRRPYARHPSQSNG